MCSSHREVVAHLKKSEVKVIGQGQGQFKNRRTLQNLHFWGNLKNLDTSVFASSRSRSTLKKFKVKVKGQGQGHLFEKYSYSNSINEFAQNQYADSSWHADFENDNHFFLKFSELNISSSLHMHNVGMFLT